MTNEILPLYKDGNLGYDRRLIIANGYGDVNLQPDRHKTLNSNNAIIFIQNQQ